MFKCEIVIKKKIIVEYIIRDSYVYFVRGTERRELRRFAANGRLNGNARSYCVARVRYFVGERDRADWNQWCRRCCLAAVPVRWGGFVVCCDYIIIIMRLLLCGITPPPPSYTMRISFWVYATAVGRPATGPPAALDCAPLSPTYTTDRHTATTTTTTKTVHHRHHHHDRG